MISKVEEKENITVYENTSLLDFLVEDGVCYGVRCWSENPSLIGEETGGNGKEVLLYANNVFLTSGGTSAIYARTTNPQTTIGDGLAVAYKNGCRIMDMEFIQFHPSGLYIKDSSKAFLISEAVRGEGAHLMGKDGKRFMVPIHELAELAPRDIVARSIYKQMYKDNMPYVILSLKHLNKEEILSRFPSINAKCQEYGYDLTKVMTVLSSLLSRHGDLAIYGMYDRAEGMITKLCYLILFLYTMLSCRNETCLKLGLGALSVAVLANAVFGISQFIGHDIFNTQWFGELVIPDSIGGTLSTPGGLFSKMYGLLNHYNYMGSFAATTLPVFGVIALMNRRLRIRIPAAVLAALALMLLLCSTSRAGLIGTAAMVLMAAILFRHALIRRWKIVLCLFAAFLAVTVAADFATDHAVYERVPQLFDDIKTVLTDTSDREYLDEAPIRDIYSTEEGAEIVLQKGNILKLKREQDGFAFADQNGDPVVYTMNSEEYFVTEDSRFAQLKFSEQNGFYRNNPYTYLRLSYKGTQVVQFYYDEKVVM